MIGYVIVAYGTLIRTGTASMSPDVYAERVRMSLCDLLTWLTCVKSAKLTVAFTPPGSRACADNEGADLSG